MWAIQGEREKRKEKSHKTYFRNNKSLEFECVSKSGPGSARVLILSKISFLKLEYFKCIRDSTSFKVSSYLINV